MDVPFHNNFRPQDKLFFNYSPKNFNKFFFQIEFFFTSYRTLKNQSIIPVVKLMVSVITNKIISNGGIPLILFLFPAISNRCIQKKGINKLTFHKDVYMEGESLTPSLLDKACADTTASHGKIAIQRTQLTIFSIFQIFYPNET